MSVPVDDYTSAQWDVGYTLGGPIDIAKVPGGNAPPYLDLTLGGMGTIATRFGQDRDKVKGGAWSGFASVRAEDYATAMSQGALPDRTNEHLSTSDRSIVRARQILRNAATRFKDGAAHPAADPAVEWGLIRSFAEIIRADADWRNLPRG